MPYIQSGSMIRNSAMEGASSAVSSSLSPHLSEVSPLQIIALNGQGTHYIITRFILHRISHNKVLIHVSKIFFSHIFNDQQCLVSKAANLGFQVFQLLHFQML